MHSTCGEVTFPRKSLVPLPPWHAVLNSFNDISLTQSIELERSTTDQSQCNRWFSERQSRLTASVFGKVVKRKKIPTLPFMESLFKKKKSTLKVAATSWGKNCEEPTKAKYISLNQDAHVHGCGLIVNPAMSFLGATPDGKVCHQGNTGIMEIKCPYSARDVTVKEAIDTVPNFFMNIVNDTPCLIRNHVYYYQIQGQLLISGAPFCDLVVYTRKDLVVERICPDKEFMLSMLLKLSLFYRFQALPHLQSQQILQ